MAAIGKSVSDDDTVSGDDKDILEDIAKALNDGDINKATELVDSSFSFEPMTDDEAKNLLGYVVETEYATLLKSRIGTTLYNTLANSKELIALLSITYQNPSAIKQPLIDAYRWNPNRGLVSNKIRDEYQQCWMDGKQEIQRSQ